MRDSIRNARISHDNYVTHFNNKKDEHADIKKENEVARAVLKNEERMAKAFKFTKMSKKTPFLPSLNQKGYYSVCTSMDNKEGYRDHRERESLLFPARVKDFSRQMKLNKTCDGKYFNMAAGREIDKFDEVLEAYFTTRERGQIRPSLKDDYGMSIKPEKVNNVWLHNNFAPKTLEEETPRLLDRTSTPRGAMRAITLDRHFSTKKWLYNKNTCDHFNPNDAKKERARSMALKRLTRK